MQDNSRFCFKLNPPVWDKYNVIYCKDATLTLLWNKYEILLYEDGVFTSEKHSFVPDFVIENVMISSNYLICLDTNGTVHTTRLTSKNQQKRQKTSFLPQVSKIGFTYQHNKDQCLCLKLRSGLYLTLHNLQADFNCLNKIKLLFPCNQMQQIPLNTCVMATYAIPDKKATHLSTIFNQQSIQNDSYLVALSLDLQTVYAFVINSTMKESTPVNLYKCPTDISGIQIIEMETPEIIIGLKTGTLIRIKINNNLETPQIIHLNIAIHKFIAIQDTLIYTDGCTMWRVDKTFSENPKFTQLFVKQVKDFSIYDSQVICVTFTNLIYKFTLENCIETKTEKAYLPAEKLNNTGLLQTILEEIEKNDRTVQKLKTELNFVTALALSNKTELNTKVVEYVVKVYENYQNIDQNSKIILTNELHEYFEVNSIMFLIKIILSKHWKLVEVLNSLLGKLRLQITFSYESRVIKTTSILMTEILNETSILIPLKYLNYPDVNLDLFLTANVPGGLDLKTELSIIISKKTIIISSENFIKSYQNNVVQKNLCTFDLMQLKSAERHHGDVFKFIKCSEKTNEYCFYNNLPEDFANKLKTKENYAQHLNEHTAIFLLKKVSSEDFLNGKSPLSLQIGDSKIKISIGFNDYGLNVMKLEGDDPKIVFNMRNFFQCILNENHEDYKEGKMIIPKSQHKLIQDMELSLKNHIATTTSYDQSEIINMINLFNSNVISSLPL